MSKPKQADLTALIKTLTLARVDFIVIGGAAAVLHGAPISTIDLDIVHRQTYDNVNHLVDCTMVEVLTNLSPILLSYRMERYQFVCLI